MNDTGAERYVVAGLELLPNEQWHDIVPARMAYNLATGIPSSVLFLDINNLKSVNDKQGHPEGDRVLGEVSFIIAALARTLRTGTDRRSDIAQPYLTIGDRRVDQDRRTQYPKSGDLVTHRALANHEAIGIDAIAGRVGGDEFAIYAATDKKGAEAIRDRLRSTFDELFLGDPKNAKLKKLDVGIAVGTSTLTEGMSPADVLAEADALMYQDKRAQLREFNRRQKVLVPIAYGILNLAGIKISDLHKRSRM